MKNQLNFIGFALIACSGLSAIAQQNTYNLPNGHTITEAAPQTKFSFRKPVKQPQANPQVAIPEVEPAKNQEKKKPKLYNERNASRPIDEVPSNPTNYSLPSENAPLPEVQ